MSVRIRPLRTFSTDRLESKPGRMCFLSSVTSFARVATPGACPIASAPSPPRRRPAPRLAPARPCRAVGLGRHRQDPCPDRARAAAAAVRGRSGLDPLPHLHQGRRGRDGRADPRAARLLGAAQGRRSRRTSCSRSARIRGRRPRAGPHPVRPRARGGRRRAAHPDHPRLRAEPARRFPVGGRAGAGLPAARGARGAVARPRDARRAARPRRAARATSAADPRSPGAEPAARRKRRRALPQGLRPGAGGDGRARPARGGRGAAAPRLRPAARRRRRSRGARMRRRSTPRSWRAVGRRQPRLGHGDRPCRLRRRSPPGSARSGAERAATLADLAGIVLTKDRRSAQGRRPACSRPIPITRRIAARLAECCAPAARDARPRPRWSRRSRRGCAPGRASRCAYGARQARGGRGRFRRSDPRGRARCC